LKLLVVFYGATICFPMFSRKPGCHILLFFLKIFQGKGT